MYFDCVWSNVKLLSKFHEVMSGRNYYIKINMLKITFFKGHLQETEKVLEQAPREKKVIG
jgi:hypothetical protein